MASPLPTVHLVHPPPYGEVPFKHLGLASVAASLRAAGVETAYHDLSERLHREGVDFYHELILRLSGRAGDMSDLPDLTLLGEVLFPEEGDSALAATIRGQVAGALDELEGARLVGITFNTLTSYAAFALGRGLRRRGARVALGGPSSRVEAISHLALRLGAADALMVGEGDLAAPALFRALAEGASAGDVAGALRLEDDRVVATPEGPAPELDALPWPELEGHVLDQFIPVGASRGCPRRCAYCSEPGLWGAPGHRRRDPAQVALEMVTRAAATGLDDVHFHDDLLNGSRRWLLRLLDEVSGRGLAWESFFEPYRLDRPLLEAMKAAGCRLIKYGVQSFAPEVLATMRRPHNQAQVIETIVETASLGISTHFDMLIGHPGETEADHSRNLRVIRELYDRAGGGLFFSLNPFYLATGSAIADEPERFGVEVISAEISTLPTPLSEAIRRGPPYAVGYRSSVPRETTMRRMEELAAILREHDKDYLYLGQDHIPDTPRGRRVLPPLELVRDRSRPPVAAEWPMTLNDRSNLRLWARPPAGVAARGPFPDTTALRAALESAPPGRVVRLCGGEPTLEGKMLPALLTLCRALERRCVVETNGVRLSAEGFTRALARHGLRRVRVLLMATEAPLAEELCGLEGALELALAGAGHLVTSGVEVELGLLLSAPALSGAPALVELAEALGPGLGKLTLVRAELGGPSPPPPPTRAAALEALTALGARAGGLDLLVTLDDRLGDSEGV